MASKYTINISKVNKFHFNRFDNDNSDTLEFEIDTFLYDPEYEVYLKKLIDEIPAIEPHIGDLLCIMELFMEQEQGDDQYLILVSELQQPLKRLHFLQKIIESPEKVFEKVEIIVTHIRDNPLDSDFITSELELNKVLINGLLRNLKVYFDNTYQYIYLNLFNRQLDLEGITAKELEKIVKTLEIKEFNYKAYQTNLEKEMIQVVLDYLNNETNLNPRGLKMTKPLATVIYCILSIFKVITKPQKEADITNYIRDMHKNPKLSV